MGCWSAENATKAYLKTMKMGECAKEPTGAEFISALAAGNNAQLIVVTCASIADTTTLALAAAAQQTGGRVVCILRGLEELSLSQKALRIYASRVEFITGDAQTLLLNHYSEADFVAVDCNLESHEQILKSVQESRRQNNTIVLGYNAFCKESWRSSHLQTQLLPIGDGLLVTRIATKTKSTHESGLRKRSHWIVKVDICTGEEHVFMVRSTQRRAVQA